MQASSPLPSLRTRATAAWRSVLLVALVAVVGWGGTSCRGTTTATGSVPGTAPGGTAAASGRITVSAASSLRDPFGRIGQAFTAAHPGTEVQFNFDASGTLAKQIRDGAAADGFASADEATMTALADAGFVAGEPVVFARNRLTIVVKKGNPKGITGLRDLAGVGTVSLCGADVPCGRYAEEVLRRAEVTIPPEHITRGQNVKATLAAVAEGDADAGIVYVTDAGGGAVEAVTIPDAQNAVATYPIAVVKGAANDATMRAFIAYVLGTDAQAVLRSAGFLPPP